VHLIKRANCSHFIKKMYRLCPDVSTGLCGLHYVMHHKYFMHALILSALLVTSLFSGLSFGQTTFDLVVKGKSCNEQRTQQLDCDYKIGTQFWLSIASVGSSDAGVTFMKSDFNGKYYGTFGISHGCVIVKTGAANTTSSPFDLAFVSPRNGKVYKDWPSCQAAK
jgi:hypothetical protein